LDGQKLCRRKQFRIFRNPETGIYQTQSRPLPYRAYTSAQLQFAYSNRSIRSRYPDIKILIRSGGLADRNRDPFGCAVKADRFIAQMGHIVAGVALISPSSSTRYFPRCSDCIQSSTTLPSFKNGVGAAAKTPSNLDHSIASFEFFKFFPDDIL